MTVTLTTVDSNGETGGIWRHEQLTCAGCNAAVAHDVVLKVEHVRETWRIERVPTHATARTKLHCPSCDALLASACPPDAQPEPATSFSAARTAHSERETEHLCVGCSARHMCFENVATRWQGDAASIPSPRPYPRG